MTDEIIDADAAWPETQTGGEDSDCDDIIVAGAPDTDDRVQDDHELGEFDEGSE